MRKILPVSLNIKTWFIVAVFVFLSFETKAQATPSVPTGLLAVVISPSVIDLSWGPPSSGGAAGYYVYRNGVQVGISYNLDYSDSGLSPSTTYTYTVSSFDSSGDVSAQSASVNVTIPQQSAPAAGNLNGQGASNLGCINPNGNGYGVGPGCLGPVIDDSDPTVTSGAQAIAKWGSLNAFLNHLGYAPNRIWFLAPATASPKCNAALGACVGNDSTGVVNDPDHPYQTYGAIYEAGLLKSGDMLMLRDGWNGRIQYEPSGTPGHPTIIMSFPGELAVIDPSTFANAYIDSLDTSWLVIDSLKTLNGANIGGGSTSWGATTFHDNIFRHIETIGAGGQSLGGIALFNGLTNILIEKNVFHDIGWSGQHCLYVGSRNLVSTNVIVRDNVCYNAPWNGFHLNGRFTNLQVDQNFVSNVGIAGMSLQEGVSNSFFRNNVIINAASHGFEIADYPGNCAQFGQGGSGNATICPYDQTGNLFENNTVYMTLNDSTSFGAGVVPEGLVVANNAVNLVGDLGHNTFRNNIFVAAGSGGHYPAIIYQQTSLPYLSTSTFTNNIYWNQDGASDTDVFGFGPSISSYGWQSYTCAQAASLTTLSGCMNVNPKFNNASASDWDTPNVFNFTLQAGSSAIGAGVSIGAPMYDFLGTVRSLPPTIGSYDIGIASSDTTPPSVPTGLSATATSSGQINLSWNASTDNVGVTGYNIYRNGVLINTSSTTTFSDTGLPASMLYSYTVSAHDAAGNVSAQSSSVSATTLAAPSAPAGLTATAVSSTQINLSWTAPTDTGGTVAGYYILWVGDGSIIGSSATASYSVTGLTASTSYNYEVIAYDTAGNNSTLSNTATTSTLAASSANSPSVPTGLNATPASSSQINLTWTASTEAGGTVAGYDIYRNGVQVGTSTTATYSDTGLTASTAYSYTVSAYDTAGIDSAQSSSVSATTQAAAADAPVINTFTASSSTITAGQSTTLFWAVTGTPTPAISINNGVGAQTGTSVSVSPTVTTTYTLTATNTGGSTTQTITITVNPATVPAISTFTAGSPTITAGQSTTLSWVVTGTPTPTISINNSVGAQTGTSVSVSPTATTTYTLTASNSAGSVTKTVTVSVNSTGGSSNSYSIGWNELANTQLINVCPSPSPGGVSGCPSVVASWSSAVARTKVGSEQLIIWGGGHNDYYGNEVYSLNLNVTPPTLTRLNNPSTVNFTAGGGCPGGTYCEANPDGTPVARHTYNGIEYLPTQDEMFSFGGQTSPNGSGTNHTWTLTLSNLTWTDQDPTNGFNILPYTTSVYGTDCAYDSVTDSVFCADGNVAGFYQYTPATNTYTKLVTQGDFAYAAATTPAIDPVGRIMYFIGVASDGVTFKLQAVNIAAGSNYTVQDLSSQVTGCSGMGSYWPGFVYDPKISRFVGWPNTGNTIYIFNPATLSCTAQTMSGPVPPTSANLASYNGTYGRFNYFPSLDAFALVPDATKNAYVLKINNASLAAPAPSAPTGLTATPISSSQINLSWNASTESGGTVAGYNIYRGGFQVGTSTTTTYTDTGLTAATSYSYTASAFDAATGNNSAQSSAVSATTSASSSSNAPTVPTGLTATAASSTQINLSWTASTESGGTVTGYNIYRGGEQVATSTTTTYSDTGLTASTSYSYTVSAYDEAGNVSAQSTSANATTQTASTGSTYPIGWTDLTNTQLTNVCPSPSPGGVEGCSAVVSAWGGAAARTKVGSEQLIIWGGGHNDYYGNEVYSLNLNVNPATLTRLNNPSAIGFTAADCPSGPYCETNPDGTPVSRHTYNDLAYLPTQDALFSFSGGTSPNGNGNNNTWTLTLADLTWHSQDPTNGFNIVTGSSSSVYAADCAYDSVTDSVFCANGNVAGLYQYAPATDTYTSLVGPGGFVYAAETTPAIDPVGRKMYFIGASNEGALELQVVSIAAGSNYAVQDLSSQVTGCGGMGTAWPGFVYDKAISRFVGWPNMGNTVYIFNPGALSCTTQTLSGPMPPAAAEFIATGSTGVMGRFNYFPSLDAFALEADATKDAFILKINNTSATSPAGTAPSVPTGLTATAASATQVNLSWNASTESGQTVAGYNIYRGGLQVGTSATTTYSDTGLTASTSYSYTVSAYDAAGNMSAQSSSVSAATEAAGSGTPPPSVPTGLTATPASSTQINLSWTASTDSAGTLAGYDIYRGGVLVNTSTTPTYSDTGLTASTSYSYTVSAYDTAGNVSAQSGTASATTQSATLTAPVITSFTAGTSTITSGQSTTLSWGVTGTPTPTLSINNSVGTVTGTSVSVSPAATTTYILTASNSSGSVTAQATVTVVSASLSWYNASWQYRKAITISHTKVSTVNGTTLTNFPVLINITDTDLLANAQSSGNDILFTASDGATKLNYERQTYNSTTGKLIAWVQVPSLSPTVDTIIYLYFGNSSAADQSNKTGAWDSNYVTVQHLPNGTTLTANDSTTNNLNAAIGTGVSAAAGQIGGGAYFSSTNYTGTICFSSTGATCPGTSAAGPAALNIAGPYTLSVWFNIPTGTTNNSDFEQILGKGFYDEYGIAYKPSTQQLVAAYNAGSTPLSSGSTAVTAGSWHYAVLTGTSSGANLYVDGVQVGTESGTAADYSLNYATLIGGNEYYTSSIQNGTVDEARISKIARSADWISTEYLNQSSPGSFSNVSALESSASTAIAYGDLNGAANGLVTIYDAELVAQYAVGLVTLTPTQLQEAMVSSNTETSPTVYDAFLIAEYAVGLITKFPVQS